MKREITEDLIEEAMKDGFTREEAEHGYNIACAYYMGGAYHVEKIDVMDVFESDEEASKQAEYDGLALIKDIPEVNEYDQASGYVDTPENRAIIQDYLQKNYGIKWE